MKISINNAFKEQSKICCIMQGEEVKTGSKRKCSDADPRSARLGLL